MAASTNIRYTVRDVQDYAQKNGFQKEYSQVDDSKYAFLTTSELGALETPGLLIGTKKHTTDIDHELWAFLREDRVIFIHNESPHDASRELRKWSEASLDSVPNLTEGAFTSFNLPCDPPKDIVTEIHVQIKALVQCILLKHDLVDHITGADTLVYLKKACLRAVRPTYRLKDFESHGRTNYPEAYAEICNPKAYLVEDKTVTFDNGETKQSLCVRMGSKEFERTDNEVWVASIDGNLYIFVKRGSSLFEGLVERRGDKRMGPLGLNKLAASIRRTHVPRGIRVKGERRLAVFIEYVYLLTGHREEVRGEDMLPQFEKACKYALEGETVGVGGGVKKKKVPTKEDDLPRSEISEKVDTIIQLVQSDKDDWEKDHRKEVLGLLEDLKRLVANDSDLGLPSEDEV